MKLNLVVGLAVAGALTLTVTGCRTSDPNLSKKNGKLKIDLLSDRDGTLPPPYLTGAAARRATKPVASQIQAPAVDSGDGFLPSAAEQPDVGAVDVSAQDPIFTPMTLPEKPVDPPQPVVTKPAVTEPKAEIVHHTVAKGENLSLISRQYNVSIDKICDANGITNPNKVREGQRLDIPVNGATYTSRKATTTPKSTTVKKADNGIYVVEKGDIFGEIALRFNLTQKQLQDLNPQIADPSRISIGQKIRVSASAAAVGTSAKPAPAPKKVEKKEPEVQAPVAPTIPEEAPAAPADDAPAVPAPDIEVPAVTELEGPLNVELPVPEVPVPPPADPAE